MWWCCDQLFTIVFIGFKLQDENHHSSVVWHILKEEIPSSQQPPPPSGIPPRWSQVTPSSDEHILLKQH